MCCILFRSQFLFLFVYSLYIKAKAPVGKRALLFINFILWIFSWQGSTAVIISHALPCILSYIAFCFLLVGMQLSLNMVNSFLEFFSVYSHDVYLAR